MHKHPLTKSQVLGWGQIPHNGTALHWTHKQVANSKRFKWSIHSYIGRQRPHFPLVLPWLCGSNENLMFSQGAHAAWALHLPQTHFIHFLKLSCFDSNCEELFSNIEALNHLYHIVGGSSERSPVQVQKGPAWAGGGWRACWHRWIPGQQVES